MGYFNISFSLWYLKHRRLIDFVAIIFLLAVNFLIGIYIFKLTITYLISPKPRDADTAVVVNREAKDIEILRSGAIRNGDYYDLVAQIRNPNLKLGLATLAYTFVLGDEAGQTLQEVNGTSYILPGETKYLVKPNVDTQGKHIQKVELKLALGKWLEKSDVAKPSLVSSQARQKLAPNAVGQLELFGIVENQSYYHLKTVEVKVICLDVRQNILGVNYTTLNNLYAQTEREFRVRWSTDFRSKISEVVVEMDTNMYDPKNYTEMERDNGNGNKNENNNGETPTEYRNI